jgi:hypothetical protein
MQRDSTCVHVVSLVAMAKEAFQIIGFSSDHPKTPTVH